MRKRKQPKTSRRVLLETLMRDLFELEAASKDAARVRPTPESGLLAKQVSTAQARSAGGQRHFRPPGAKLHAHTAMRAPWVQGSWTVQPHFNCVFVVELNNVVSPESKQRQPR